MFVLLAVQEAVSYSSFSSIKFTIRTLARHFSLRDEIKHKGHLDGKKSEGLRSFRTASVPLLSILVKDFPMVVFFGIVHFNCIQNASKFESMPSHSFMVVASAR